MTETQLRWPTGSSCDQRVQGQLDPAPTSSPTLSRVLSVRFSLGPLVMWEPMLAQLLQRNCTCLRVWQQLAPKEVELLWRVIGRAGVLGDLRGEVLGN